MTARLILTVCAILFASAAYAADVIKVAVTTSFDASGLADVLLPVIKQDLGLEVQLLVVGTGQAIKLGTAGDVDAILVHSKSAEDAFVSAGFGTHRREIMYNDFVVVGPENDSAGVSSSITAAQALQAIAARKSDFVTRGDDSGTHKKELLLWANAALDPDTFAEWYKDVGAGMGGALNTASGLDAYILSDRASWLNFGNKGNLVLLFEGDPELFNQYAFVPVNPDLHPHTKSELVTQLESWLVSDQAKALIDGYRVNGQTLFVFNAVKD